MGRCLGGDNNEYCSGGSWGGGGGKVSIDEKTSWGGGGGGTGVISCGGGGGSGVISCGGGSGGIGGGGSDKLGRISTSDEDGWKSVDSVRDAKTGSVWWAVGTWLTNIGSPVSWESSPRALKNKGRQF